MSGKREYELRHSSREETPQQFLTLFKPSNLEKLKRNFKDLPDGDKLKQTSAETSRMFGVRFANTPNRNNPSWSNVSQGFQAANEELYGVRYLFNSTLSAANDLGDESLT
jgi:hypothetical protein